ncbi:hypothetical protein NHP190012_00550 [Helicobacter sp. NHP19-012]|uniref:GmrSD restriction endonucleases N-terminal domain-containing protein n=1 Tax=Helicobacter gastrofelis TaxID=2849642 RepID=A0ABM7SCI0_9HELI|nr:DUF262 domain-containing protein [Helicobacter sp. NHP19-012]BCZ18413.1 hypothetical protein NHP190012_00550 [Helicobacter sp. NHP19-012]
MSFCNYDEKGFAQLVRFLEEGEYQIPRFQRDFVWSKEQVAKFIDSLVRGFPTGSFVLWKTKERLQANRKIGKVEIRKPKAEEHIYYVLDGQQRMGALFVVFKGLQIERKRKKDHYQEKNTQQETPVTKPPKIDDYKDIMLRLEVDEDKDFCFVGDPKAELNEVAVSVYDLITQSILEIQEKYNLSLQEAKRFEEFKKRMENYRFPIVAIDNAPLEQIVEIFARINTGGTKLTPFEVMCAKFYSPAKTDPSQTIIIKPKFDLQECFENLTDELGHLDYAFNQPMVVLQLISYLLHSNASNLKARISIPTILKLEPEKVQETWNFAAPCFSRAAHLLKHDLKIPSFDFLPSVGLFMLMAYFYALSGYKSPNASQITNLRRLFFRGAFFSTKTDGDTLLKQLGLVKCIYEEKPIDFKKELPFYSITQEFLTGEKINIKSGLHRGVLCVLATLEPRDFDNNSKVVLDNLFLQNTKKRNLHHFFPKNHLKHIAPKSNPDVIANVAFLSAQLNQHIKDKPPKVYIPEFHAKNPHLQDSLKTHLIDINDPKVLENYQDFLKLRATAILDKIKELT